MVPSRVSLLLTGSRLYSATTFPLCSLWLQMAAGSSGGVLVAKTADSGSTVFYGLEVTANGGDFLIRFSYLPASRTVYNSS